MDSKSLDCFENISRNMDVNNFVGEDLEEVRNMLRKILCGMINIGVESVRVFRI